MNTYKFSNEELSISVSLIGTPLPWRKVKYSDRLTRMF